MSRETAFRWLVDIYRNALLDNMPDVCERVDSRARDAGYGFVCSDLVVDVNTLMSAEEIANEFGFKIWNIRDWARRHPDQIPQHKNGRRVMFRLGDVLRFEADNRDAPAKR